MNDDDDDDLDMIARAIVDDADTPEEDVKYDSDTSSKRHLLHVLLFDKSHSAIKAMEQAMGGKNGRWCCGDVVFSFEVAKTTVSTLASNAHIDVIVSPSNCVGEMSGGIDESYVREWGWKLGICAKHAISSTVGSTHSGRPCMTVGQAVLTPITDVCTAHANEQDLQGFTEEQTTGAASTRDGSKPKYLVLAPTMTLPENIAHTNNVYHACYAAVSLLISAMRHASLEGEYNQDLGANVICVAMPVLGTGYGGMDVEQAAT